MAEEDEKLRAIDFLPSRVLSDEDKMNINSIKALESEFLSCLSRIEKATGGSRYFSLAKTSIEAGTLWAVKAITGV